LKRSQVPSAAGFSERALAETNPGPSETYGQHRAAIEVQLRLSRFSMDAQFSRETDHFIADL